MTKNGPPKARCPPRRSKPWTPGVGSGSGDEQLVDAELLLEVRVQQSSPAAGRGRCSAWSRPSCVTRRGVGVARPAALQLLEVGHHGARRRPSRRPRMHSQQRRRLAGRCHVGHVRLIDGARAVSSRSVISAGRASHARASHGSSSGSASRRSRAPRQPPRRPRRPRACPARRCCRRVPARLPARASSGSLRQCRGRAPPSARAASRRATLWPDRSCTRWKSSNGPRTSAVDRSTCAMPTSSSSDLSALNIPSI